MTARHGSLDRIGVLALLASAVVLLSLGVGIGLGWAREGWSVLAVVGCAALLLGAVEWVLAARAVVRAGGGVRRWVGLPLAGLLSLVLVYVLAVPLAAAVSAPVAVGATPAGLGLAYRDVRIPAGGSATLAGWWLPSHNGAAVGVLHGSGSTRSSTLAQAAVLSRHGYGVLLVDARGHGDSTGRGMDWGWFGDQDVAAAVTFLRSAPGVDPRRVALLGLSMGGEEAIGAMGRDPRIRAVVAEGVTGRSARDLGWLSDAYGWRGGVTAWVHSVQTSLADVLSPARIPPPLGDEVAAASPRPLLLVTAGTRPDEGHAATALEQRSPRTVEVWTVPGAGHCEALATEPEAWEARVTGFLRKALG
ncbi:hypothetical protein GCM10027517_14070 [Phycicoccus ginsengisoli]